MFQLGPGARRVVRDSLVWHSPIGFRRTVTYAVLVLLASLALARHAFVADPALLKDEHAVISLELAMTRAFCGRTFFFSHAAQVSAELKVDASLRNLPLRDLIARRAGSVPEYCRQAEWPRVNNENSLMLLEAAFLQVQPDLSFAELGRRLHAVRIAALCAFVVLLVNFGASVWMATGAMVAGLVALNALPEYGYSVYPFLSPLVLALATAYGFAVRYLVSLRLPAWLVFAAAIGIGSAFAVNMRTSYLPIVVLFAVLFLLASWRMRPGGVHWRSALVRVLAFVLCFAAGYAGFERTVITRHLPDGAEPRTTHSIMHPLVLALGVPETAFSREQGIRWEDAVGPAKASSVDPQTDYLGPRYDRALKTYYWSLWHTHTSEMLSAYRVKFATSGTQMFEVLRGSPGSSGLVIAALLAPLNWLASVIWLAALYAAVFLGCTVVFWRRRFPVAFALALLTAAACVVQVEAGIIYSLFVQQYHNFAGFYAMFISLAGVQAVINAADAVLARDRASVES